MSAGALNAVVALLPNVAQNDEQLAPLLYFIGMLCASDTVRDDISEAVAMSGVLPYVVGALKSPNENLQRQAAFAVKHTCR
jgi:hypothetical protein